MELTTAQAAKRTYVFSRGAAKLFGAPAPYFVGFGGEFGSLDPCCPMVVVSAAAWPATLKVSLAEEADPFGPQDLLQLDGFPLWPIAVLEPTGQSHRLTMELFLNSLPKTIRDSIVQIPPGSDISRQADDAMRRHAGHLVEHSVSADRALVRLRQLHEETQRAFRELEQFVLQNTKLDSALPPVRLPRGRQSVRLASGSRAVQRLVADSYRLAGVEIELLSVPEAGGCLSASLTRDGEDGPWVCWDLDLEGSSAGAVLLRLERASLEQAAGLSLTLDVSLHDHQQHLDLAATGPQVLSHMQAQIFESETAGSRPRFAIAHAVHRGLPGARTVKHALEVVNTSRESALARRTAGPEILRADLSRAMVLAPAAAILEGLEFPLVALAPDDPAELQVHPVQGEPVLTAIALPGLEAGTMLNVPIRIAHQDSPELLVRLLYGPAAAEHDVLRLLPGLLNEAEDPVDELQTIGVSPADCVPIAGTDDPAEISVPITLGTAGTPSRLYVALRTRQEGAGVSYGWFRLRQPRGFAPPLQHHAGEP